MIYKTLILIGISVLLASCQQKSGSSNNERRTNVVVSEVQERDMSSVRVVTAPVIAYKRVYITTRTSGLITELPFEEGDLVKKGDMLFRLDVRKQEAQLRNARSALLEAQRHFERSKVLFKGEAISEEQFEQANRTMEAAESEVDFWEAEVSFGKMHAQMDAVVAAKLAEPGTNVSENQRIYTIEDHNLLVARPGVSELDVVHLAKGQEVALTFDVFGEERFTGTIRRIFPAADQITRLFTVEVEIDQSQTDFPIRPGYLTRVYFTTDERANAVAVPSEGIDYDNDEAMVFVIDENQTLTRTKVTTGIERDGWIEITGGIQPGQKIVAGNLDSLEDGMKVNVTGNFRRYGFRE
ncbi:efflux RND transporter periplasmic adaptor subunit [Natronoflexus pectinivorans]|uniref:RND family efflux transporter MFP subunit n=1 Tax=Natronoflexus pectinivorans TaxID=682526 RepID=A0A4R2GGA6_9BACT|nr:efflux RND transporter periplasmic adaptor subunit [Natronoflexus pectinivorans]TCO07055.1 RND family efflux transporter MFP subunit [Natronoflexus pectinivorans]